jgi:hypothetical protein
MARLVDAIALGDPPAALRDRLIAEERRARDLRDGLGREREPVARLTVEAGVRTAQARLAELAGDARRGGVHARPVLGALLGGGRIRAVPVREAGQLRWHLSADVSRGWLLASVTDGPLAGR